MNKGFTLLEIIIAIGILSGIVFAISMFGIDVFDFGIFLGENLTSQQEIQLTLKVMISEMRAMSQSVSGAYPIESASQNSIIFYTDINGDGISDRVRYFLQGTTFYKGVIEPTGNPLVYNSADEEISEVVHNIYTSGGNIFAYYDSDYSGTEAQLSFPINIPLVRLVKVNITVDPNPIDPSSRINFSAIINMRNL